MKCKNCKFKTEMNYNEELQCHVCPDCGFEDYGVEDDTQEYDTRGLKETCLNCGKVSCNLAGVGNKAGVNENNGCWIPQMAQEIIDSVIAEEERKSNDAEVVAYRGK